MVFQDPWYLPPQSQAQYQHIEKKKKDKEKKNEKFQSGPGA